jgi:hypothetical protein
MILPDKAEMHEQSKQGLLVAVDRLLQKLKHKEVYKTV